MPPKLHFRARFDVPISTVMRNMQVPHVAYRGYLSVALASRGASGCIGLIVTGFNPFSTACSRRRVRALSGVKSDIRLTILIQQIADLFQPVTSVDEAPLTYPDQHRLKTNPGAPHISPSPVNARAPRPPGRAPYVSLRHELAPRECERATRQGGR